MILANSVALACPVFLVSAVFFNITITRIKFTAARTGWNSTIGLFGMEAATAYLGHVFLIFFALSNHKMIQAKFKTNTGYSTKSGLFRSTTGRSKRTGSSSKSGKTSNGGDSEGSDVSGVSDHSTVSGVSSASSVAPEPI